MDKIGSGLLELQTGKLRGVMVLKLMMMVFKLMVMGIKLMVMVMVRRKAPAKTGSGLLELGIGKLSRAILTK